MHYNFPGLYFFHKYTIELFFSNEPPTLKITILLFCQVEKKVSLQIMEVNDDLNDVVNLSNDFPTTATNVSSFSQKRTLPMPPKEPRKLYIDGCRGKCN